MMPETFEMQFDNSPLRHLLVEEIAYIVADAKANGRVLRFGQHAAEL